MKNAGNGIMGNRQMQQRYKIDNNGHQDRLLKGGSDTRLWRDES
jgi:hypothetical protein